MSLNRKQRHAVEGVMTVTGCTKKQAAHILAACGWSVEVAVDNFFASGMVSDAPPTPAVDSAKVNAMFDAYKDPDEDDEITGEGVSKLGAALGIDVTTDLAILVFAQHCGCEQMGVFTREEWGRGMTKIGCDSLEALGKRMDELREELKDPDAFPAFFNFIFDFSREAGQKGLGMDMAAPMLQLVLGPRYPLCPLLCEFLGTQKHSMSRDSWRLLLEFTTTVKPDFSNYSDDDAWPVLLDDFVDFAKARLAADEKK